MTTSLLEVATTASISAVARAMLVRVDEAPGIDEVGAL